MGATNPATYRGPRTVKRKIRLPKLGSRKKRLILILGLLFIAAIPVAAKRAFGHSRGVGILKNTHLVFMCPLQKGFSLLPNINPFSKFDCGEDYPGKSGEEPDKTPLWRRTVGGEEFCNRFPNAQGCR